MTVRQNVAFGAARRASTSCSSASASATSPSESPTRDLGRRAPARRARARARARARGPAARRAAVGARRAHAHDRPRRARGPARRSGAPDAHRHPRLPRRDGARRPDRGDRRRASCASSAAPPELLEHPADAFVARLTGGNVLPGLAGENEAVVAHPWELTLAAERPDGARRSPGRCTASCPRATGCACGSATSWCSPPRASSSVSGSNGARPRGRCSPPGAAADRRRSAQPRKKRPSCWTRSPSASEPAALAQVADEVPVQRADVLAARLGIRAAEREVHRPADLLVEEDRADRRGRCRSSCRCRSRRAAGRPSSVASARVEVGLRRARRARRRRSPSRNSSVDARRRRRRRARTGRVKRTVPVGATSRAGR